jgi:hypothetical protein
MDLKLYSNQLDSLVFRYRQMKGMSQYNDLSDLPKHERQGLVTNAIALIHRITGENSTYSKEIIKVQTQEPDLHVHTSSIIGIVQALKSDIDNGYLQSLVELIHGDIFSDFLEMASYLNESKFKDAAAVIAGSTLENHLKQLATKNSIPLNDVNDRPKKVSSLNVELTKAGVYEKLDSKNVTAWLDLRNKAAHGNYEEYNLDQVNLLISSIQNFITRKPA